MTFDEAIQQHKDNLTKNLSEFGEGHRLNRLHKEIDSNAADYEYYFNAGQQAQQAKVEELQNYLYSIRDWIDENKFEPTETWLTCSVLDVDEFLDVFCIDELSKNPKSCNHESNGIARLSSPPTFQCKKCGECYREQALKGEG